MRMTHLDVDYQIVIAKHNQIFKAWLMIEDIYAAVRNRNMYKIKHS